MPYLHLDLPGAYPVEVKRELATRLCKLYADLMETQLWRPNVGIAELGKDNLYHLGPTASNPSPWSWSSSAAAAPRNSGWPWRAIVDACVELPVSLRRPRGIRSLQRFRAKEHLFAARCGANSTNRRAAHEQLDAGVDDRPAQGQPLFRGAAAAELDHDHGDGFEAVGAEV